MRHLRYFIISATLSIIILLHFSSRLQQNGIYNFHEVDEWIHSSTKNKSINSCGENLDWLKSYQLFYPIKYVSRVISVAPSFNSTRPSLTYIDASLFNEFAIIDLEKASLLSAQKCLPPLRVEVTQHDSSKVEASNIIFGLQTTIARLRDTVKHLNRWLPNTDARLYAIVIENEETRADDNEMAKLQQEFHDLHMNVTLMHPVRADDSFAQRYFSLVSVMYEARDANTEWITCIDDDTFFPSMYDLRAMLKNYDAKKPFYIGSLSEDWWAVKQYGFMAFGGAGIFLSLSLAEILYKNRESCGHNLRTTAGDITVMDCIYKFSTTKLTHIPALHQVDIHGDVSGFYESGRDMLSLHHWKEGSAGYKLEMEKMHLVTSICDSCFLQRWQFSNDLLLTNGFSITTYPQGHISNHENSTPAGLGVEKINLDDVESTWNDNLDVLHSLAPTRDKLSDESKKTYRLLDSFQTHDGNNIPVVRQIYFLKGEEKDNGRREGDSIISLIWRSK
ncbi:glycosyltransferase family 31 [Erysiphe neolycopersici]|uniref:Glycosyltransferase family 31 n=1 Tax=Erysiphe neolycopersici TaxID=212602 RepID=A0A420HKT2_9PEZI|nr:glycosyltransferase family 31 [Erysiphe neolycopersici]